MDRPNTDFLDGQDVEFVIGESFREMEDVTCLGEGIDAASIPPHDCDLVSGIWLACSFDSAGSS